MTHTSTNEATREGTCPHQRVLIVIDAISFYDRLQDVAQPQYSQEEADRAAGMTKEVLPPAHPVHRSV